MSKTDLVRYVRCPYSWWLLDRGEITFEETVDEFQVQLIQEGVAFQQLVEASAAPVVISDEDWAAYLASDRVLLGTPTFENPRLHILGRPDGIDCGRGAVAPIEVKSHQEVTRSDELELAFYWLLLAPWRTSTAEATWLSHSPPGRAPSTAAGPTHRPPPPHGRRPSARDPPGP